jgi:hypothetical protein
MPTAYNTVADGSRSHHELAPGSWLPRAGVLVEDDDCPRTPALEDLLPWEIARQAWAAAGCPGAVEQLSLLDDFAGFGREVDAVRRQEKASRRRR